MRDGEATLVALPSERPALTLQYVAAFDEPWRERPADGKPGQPGSKKRGPA